MKKNLLVLLLVMYCVANGLQAQVNQKMIDSLVQKAEQLRKLANPDAIRKNPDSVLKVINKYLKTADSTRNAVVNDALKDVPNGAVVKRLLAVQAIADTSYTTVQFNGSMSQHSQNNDVAADIRVSCNAPAAPLIQHGSTYSITLMSEALMPALTAGSLRIAHGPQAKYMTSRMAVSGMASYSGHEKSSTTKNGGFHSYTINKESVGGSNKRQFVFSFDTLTNMGQVSYIEYTPIKVTNDYGNNPSNYVIDNSSIGVSANTDPASWRMSAVTKDSAMRKMDTLTRGRLARANTKDDGSARPVLTVIKTLTGFVLKCDFDHTENGQTESIHLTAFIGRPLVNYEAIIYPVVPVGDAQKASYEHWLPRGPKLDGSDDKKGDDKLSFLVVVRDRANPAKIYHNYTATWSLTDVTKYAGFCNNYPKYSDDPNVDPDLRFHDDTKNDPDFNGAVTDNIAITNPGKGEQAKVKINCMDYAAWGKLSVHIKMDDGSEIDGHPYYEPNTISLTIPYDKDENRLADYWEQKVGTYLSGHPLTWDEDDKMEQKESGDGYTLFEEYRGFHVEDNVSFKGDKIMFQDNFVRTDPAQKDIFIYDKDDLFKKYYAADNPAHLNWHYVLPGKDEIVFLGYDNFEPSHRWINFNKVDEYFYARQYGMFLLKELVAYTPMAGGITWSKAEYDFSLTMQLQSDADRMNAPPTAQDKQGPLVVFYKCVVYVPAIQSKFKAIIKDYGQAKYDAIVANQIKITVIHEVGHNIGIVHHKAPAGATNTPAADNLACATADGVMSCPMRYYNDAEAQDLQEVSTPAYNYCRKGQAAFYFTVKYGLDALNMRIDKPRYIVPGGTKDSDDCWGQITVKSNPVE